ncbi:probable ATP-dependent DNA helicase HFM1 [Rhopilema esculentum]|uniref:probable ATP-dependent DNA helicase HFM1 n=1 Tax=Rhopilema esculentum TaxID=499914 RepID=UPI0031CEF35A
MDFRAEKYRKIFDFPYFNVVQSKVFDDVLYSDMPLVICAPTGSGKTVLFELAIIRLLLCNALEADLEYKIVYMAPIKALCSERHKDWSTKFESCGLKCTELTGDTDMDDFHVLQYAHVVLTTPEKWDSMTRKWKDHKSLVQSVRLFLIDEVHLLSDESRGATMEAVVSRMKTVQSSITKEKAKNEKMQAMRIIAVSATIPNVEDVGQQHIISILEFYRNPYNHFCNHFYSMGDEYRPVTLRRVVLGYPCSENMSDFKFDLSLNYKLSGIIQTYSDCKPTLVFCSTRKGVAQAAATLSKEARFIMDSQHKSRLMKYSNTIHDAKLRDIILFGVGYHHAGMDISDRKSIESMFVRGELPVLFCTSTLAMGVNLPAHLVVIKSTMHYVVGMYEEYTESQVLQMIGRAGRPQFDTSATAVIMTKSSNKQKYQALVNGAQTIESSLHRHLIEHINAEIFLGTIPTTKMAEEWLKSTFLYKRMQKNPSHYTMGLRALRSLQSLNLLEIKEDGSLIPTGTGKLMARYCIAFNTVKSFSEVKGSESMEELVEILSKSKEFEDITLRVSEKKVLNTLNKDKHRVTIRFPMKNKIKTTDQKINCLIQAVLGCLTVSEFSLMQDIAKIFRSGQRVSRFLSEYLLMKGAHKAAMNAVILNKCIRARLWENSKFVSRQLDKIGATMSTALVHAGLTTLEKMENINPRELEMIVGRHPPFGSQVKDALAALPKYDIAIDQVCSHVTQDENYQKDKAELYIKLTMLNAETRSKHTKTKKTQFHHSSLFLIADASNAIIFKQRLMDSMFFKEGSWSKHITIKRTHRSAELTANLISSDYVGVDLQLSFTPNYLPGFPTYFPKENTMRDENKTPSKCLENKENAAADSKTKRRKSCTHKCLNKD